MADEFVKKLGLDISDSLQKLIEFEKAFKGTMGRVDDQLDNINNKKRKKSKHSDIFSVVDFENTMVSLKEMEKAYAQTLTNISNAMQKKKSAGKKDNFLYYFGYDPEKMAEAEKRFADEAYKAKLKSDKLGYKYRYQAAAEEEKRLEKLREQGRKAIEADQKEKLRLEKEYSDIVKENANNMLDVYTDVMNRVVNVIARAFKDAISYVEEYDKALTSIALVTMKPDSKGEIGETYENLAKEMSVTATELAAAGEELYRQGLGDSEVLNRMEAITVYSKISGEAFSDSVEMITAAVNSFSKEGEDNAELTMHIVDTWALLGDAVATSASEIGVAMQKVAASGQAAGFTMEELSASIAVIESQTRAAAESVGTALNSMMSRYMKVSSAGWNTFVTTDEGDVVKINDIAKALDSVGISIVNAKGEFLNFSEILTNLNTVWDDISDANKNYIATQMAGTRSLNYFLSLMNNYEDVLELTAQGYDSAGTALEKYGIWTEGVEASQNRLSAAMQDFYSNVLSSDTIIRFTEGLTDLVEFFDNATTSSGKANIGLGLFAAALMMGVSVLGKFKSIAGSFGESLKAIARGFTTSSAAINATSAAAKGATVAVGGLKAVMISFGIGLAVTAVTSLVTWLVSLKEETETTAEKLARLSDEMNATAEALNNTQNNMSDVKTLISRLDDLGQKTSYTAEEIEEFNNVRNELIAKAPELASLYEIESGVINDLGTEYERTAKFAKQLHDELAVDAWKTAADGMDSALESLEQITRARIADDDTDRAKMFDISFNLSENAKKHEIIKVSNSAYDAYMDQGYTNVHELQDLVDDHAEVLDEYDMILEEKWKSIAGKDKEIDVSGGYTQALQTVANEVAALEEELKITGDQKLNTQIEKLKEFSDDLKEYYLTRGELTRRQGVYTEALTAAQDELSKKEREAWEIIVRGSSRANEVIAGYGYELYDQLLNSMMGVDFAENNIANNEITKVVTALFADITDEMAVAISNGNDEIGRIIEDEIGEKGVTKEIIDKLAAEDKNITSAVNEWSDGLVDEVYTSADDYIKQWRNTMQMMYENLAKTVTDPMQMDILKTRLEHSDLSMQLYGMIAQAMTIENIDIQALLDKVLGMTEDEAMKYLLNIIVEAEVETEPAETTFKEKLQEMIDSFARYTDMIEIRTKIKAGVDLAPDELMKIAEAAEAAGLNIENLSGSAEQLSAVNAIISTMEKINGEDWDNYNWNTGTKDINKDIAYLNSEIKAYEKLYEIMHKIESGEKLNGDDIEFITGKADDYGITVENIDNAMGQLGLTIKTANQMLEENSEAWKQNGFSIMTYLGYLSGIQKSPLTLYQDAVNKRDNMQLLYDSVSGIANDGSAYDLSALFNSYPQLIEYAGDINELRDQAIILLNAEKEANKEVLEQYGLFIDEGEDLANVINAYAKGISKAEKAADKLRNAQSLTGAECKELMDEYPELTESIIDYANGVLDAEELIKKLDKAAGNANISKLTEGLAEALEDYDAAAENSYDATAALERMGYLLSGGMGNMSSLDFAMQNLDLIRQAIEGDIDAFRQLNENAVVNIVGSADVDFTAVEDGLIAVGNISEATLEQLAKLGNFEITYVQAKSRIVTQGENGEPQSVLVVNEYPKIKFKDMSGFSGGSKGSSGGGGSSGHSGGGGGSGKSETNTGISEQVQNSIDEMEKELKDKDYRLEIAIAWEDYYDATGELNKTIPFMREQIEIYEEMSAAYEQNIGELRRLVAAKEAEINTVQAQIASNTQMRDQYAKGSKTYKKYENIIAELREKEAGLTADYDALSDKLGEYELANIDVQTEIENTTRAIKDQEAAIRDLIISMQESIQGFFEEIEDTENKILDATISMQDLILDTLKSQAEEEMELDREVLENKKATLTEELDAIRKNFEEARKLAQGNADEDELALLQNELAAVIADPARAGERAAIEKKIAELQSEMAWNAAEEQIAAQENAMQNEMDNIDKKIEKMEEAYDSIGKYSEKMLEEMYVIMSKTDEEIIQWLSNNSNEYADATEEGRKQLEKSWAETLKTMRDDTEKSWNEINDILNNGTVNDVLSILRNTASYRSASSEQQQKMEDEVRQAWDDMEKGQKALETPVTETITPAATTPTVTPIDETQDTISATTRARFHLRKGHSTDYESIVYMPKGAKVEVDGYNGNWVHGKYDGKEGWVWGDAFTEELDLSKLKKYAQGGLADYTGLAWLDGTPGRPEMVLDSAQTEAFRKFVFMLDKWRMPEINGGTTNGNLTVDGDIVVQVGGINTGDDYEDVGQKVMDAIYDKFKVRR